MASNTNQNKSQQNDDSPEKRKLEMLDVVKEQLSDPPASFAAYIEEQVVRRVNQKMGKYLAYVIGGAAVITVIGWITIVEWATERVTKAVFDGVIKETTNNLANIKSNAVVDEFKISEMLRAVSTNQTTYLTLSLNTLNQFSNTVAGYVRDVTNHQNQVAVTGEEYLSAIAKIRSKDNLYAITDLLSLVYVQTVTNGTLITEPRYRGPSRTILTVPLDYEPIASEVEISTYLKRDNRQFPINRIGDVGYIIGTNAFFTNQHATTLHSKITTQEWNVTFHYLKKPHFRQTPTP